MQMNTLIDCFDLKGPWFFFLNKFVREVVGVKHLLVIVFSFNSIGNAMN